MAESGAKAGIVILAQVEWNFVWVFSQDLARHFSGLGLTVVYLDPFPKRVPPPSEWRRLAARLLGRPRIARCSGHKRPPGVSVVTPLTLPDTHPFFSWINRRWILPRLRRRIDSLLVACGRRILFLFLPFATPMALARLLKPDLLVYAMRSGWGVDPHSARAISMEGELIERADLIVTTGRLLTESVARHRAKTVEISAMVDFEQFCLPPPPPRGQGPARCCFYGHLNERIDLDLLAAVAGQCRLRLIGPRSVPLPNLGSGLELLPMASHEELPGLLQDVDLFIFPYRLDPFTRHVFPYKVYECLATGRPVVSTRLPCLEPLAQCLYFATGAGEFLEQIGKALAEPPEAPQRRREMARRCDREAVLASLDRILFGEAGSGGA